MRIKPKFSEEEIPNDNERIAKNCFYSSMECNENLFNYCKKEFSKIWIKCPKNINKEMEK